MVSAKDSGSIVFQSTLSVRRATQFGNRIVKLFRISIHALRKESDQRKSKASHTRSTFQSTLSVRRAT